LRGSRERALLGIRCSGKPQTEPIQVGSTPIWAAALSSKESPAAAKENRVAQGQLLSSARRGEPCLCMASRKKDRGNINDNELQAFRELARVILGYTNDEIAKRVADGALIEVQAQEGEYA
jgi:hypothetical protein